MLCVCKESWTKSITRTMLKIHCKEKWCKALTASREHYDKTFAECINSKHMPVSGLKRKNRGTRGDSLHMLSPLGLSNKKPLLLTEVKVVGACHGNPDDIYYFL